MRVDDHQKRFCVLTTGRTASTALMDALEKFGDIAVPNKNIECRDNELVTFEHLLYGKDFSRLCGREIENEGDLIDCFFHYNSEFRFAGFKSMPNRFKDYPGFISREDIRFITLTRDDIASAAASFETAKIRNTWRRSGETPSRPWTFTPRHTRRVASNIKYIHQSWQRLNTVPNPVKLTYEELTAPGFSSPELDEYFQRPIRIDNPKGPTAGKAYVTNWNVFEDFVMRCWETLSNRMGDPRLTQ